VTDDEWLLLEQRKQLEGLRSGRLAPEAVANDLIQQRRTYPSPTFRQRSPSDGRLGNQKRRTVHDRALGQLFIAQLRQDQEKTDEFRVKAFRQTVLGGKSIGDVRQWVADQVRQQRRPSKRNGRVRLVSIRIDGDVMRRATRAGRPLDTLRKISDRLAECYRWDPADAAAYVLTDTPPPVRSITADVRLTWPILARSTITLRIGPTATPNEVAAMYSHLRRQEFGRVRRLNSKHAALAVFVAERQKMTDAVEREIVVEEMNEWNRINQRWRYTFPSVFKRDAAMAFTSLTNLQPQRRRR
jgi:hypothetical protein